MTAGAIDALEAALQREKASGRKLLVPFVTAGYPDLDTTADVVLGMREIGVDVVELGVPFSDPLADGPKIAAASEAALERGASLERTLDIAERVSDVAPIVLFTYLNPLDAYGLSRLAQRAGSAGVTGVLVADLPFDEDPEIEDVLQTGGVALIRLAAPASSEHRLRDLAGGARGFIYLIARTGVTGGGAGTDERTARQVAVLREETSLPIVVGFGIGDVDAARRAAEIADGVVIGTALVEKLEAGGATAALEWLGTIREGLDSG